MMGGPAPVGYSMLVVVSQIADLRDRSSSRYSRLFGAVKRPDVVALLALLAFTVVAEWDVIVGGTMVGQDAANLFYPPYSFLAERLRSGEIPAWSPHQFAGAPFAGDPQSGWMYWPAMLLFGLLPLSPAAKSYTAFHLLLAGFGTYGLARSVGIGAVGALASAISYELTGYLYERHIGCFVCAGITAWLPVTLLCAEMAIRSRRIPTRIGRWAAGGFAVSQALAVWLGQGSYYVLLALGAYVAYRTLVSPPSGITTPRDRILALAANLGVPVAFGFALAAAGILPRIEYNTVSNLAGGYRDAQHHAVIGAWSTRDFSRFLARATVPFYVGGATLGLALLAPMLARRRHACPFWTALALAALALTHSETPLHQLLYALLPGFERLHPHNPGRILPLFYLGVALLAGASVTRLPGSPKKAAVLAVIPPIGLLSLSANGVVVDPVTSRAILAAAVLVAACLLISSSGRLMSCLLVLLIFADLFSVGRSLLAYRLDMNMDQAFRKVNLDTFYEPSEAARFLAEKHRLEPFRYFGYDPRIPRLRLPYRFLFADPVSTALLVNNRASRLGLDDVTGRNPLHLVRYDEYMRALNGGLVQEYQESYVFPKGLDSPLLDLLNVRYMIVPAARSPEWTELRGLHASYETTYEDRQVRVLERRETLPRAWIVHSARRVAPGKALGVIESGQVDPRREIVLEAPPPVLAQPGEASADTATITSYEPERISLSVRTESPGILVLSEMYYPAWKAYVDGRPAPVFIANHTLRAVPIPSGSSEVVLRYESVALRVGVVVSLVAHGALAALVFVPVLRRHRPAGRLLRYLGVRART